MAFGLVGQRVRLVPAEREKHAATYHQWLNDYEVSEGLLISPPHLIEHGQKFFDRMAESKTDIAFAIELLDGTHIGATGIHNINQPPGTAITGCFIGRKDLWGQGFAVEANRLRSKYCFEVLGLRVVHSGYIDGNAASARMQVKIGYLECGRLPQKFWRRDRYADEVLTCLTRERWLELEANGYPK
ncbi:MAG: GNAT family N-acetyltransferase [Chthonomonas sp.]|nr:GNAT family N-acetyltransferase [Chthonomonas sp.]